MHTPNVRRMSADTALLLLGACLFCLGWQLYNIAPLIQAVYLICREIRHDMLEARIRETFQARHAWATNDGPAEATPERNTDSENRH